MTRLRTELILVLAITFGLSGVRSALRLADALLGPALNDQQVVLNSSHANTAWLDVALQACSAASLMAWGGLAVFLLAGDGVRLPRWRRSDAAWAHALAAVIGVPGLGLYALALHMGWTKEVIPASFDNAWAALPSLLLWSAANAFAEEVVVVWYLITRLAGPRSGACLPRSGACPVRSGACPVRSTNAERTPNLGWGVGAAIAASAVLRGSYHLYQGVSAGFGNIAMGLVYGYFFARTGRVWPLIVAHFLIDAVAFVGYALWPDLAAALIRR